MSYEVEQKFRVPNHALVAFRLAALGARPGPPLNQQDLYLNHPSRNFAETNEALRIRTVGDLNVITYKGPKRPGPIKTRKEIEVEFAQGPLPLDQIRTIFALLGFKTIAIICKQRTPYHLHIHNRQVEVVLDVAENLGAFVEVETIALEDSDLAEAQRLVHEVAASLGLDNLETRSYLRMTLEQQA